mmetsp:Transcript_16546/g.40497  ORF Transcript_16546/g.40497 Transcript_16546/m.40497 type:complete len:315 (-) Transcript_16546:168-1112(-)|eukprot:CAMPEP_0197576596 /NCGR_PEP_ID=MMETSP1326-20131121/1567_1 /TAXON_ID=1155430 /ORGANISM="Genus nov. species nov., Strain RCC2288" /LENGTH=314 /DNA_ID=CAMNT_0043139551 /DNA_START=148 /DNA_END=1092 /DNA_ORIENTATION=-
MPQVYEEPISRRHYAPYFSVAFLYRPLCIVTSLILAFVIALTTGGLWVKTHSYVTQPHVRFKYDMVLVLETATPGQERVWSTFDSVNALVGAQLAAVDIQASERDLNMDGKMDVIDIKAVARGVGNVHGCKAMMAFDYVLGGRVDLVMNGMAYAQHSSPLPGSGFFVDGYLKLEQRDAIRAGATRAEYNTSVFPFAQHGEAAGDTREAAALRLPVILNEYNFRNESTFLDAKTPVWEAAASSDFTFQARVRIPTSQEVLYRPHFLELCKFAWVQILSLYVVFHVLFTRFEYVVFHHRVVSTRVVSDLQPKTHRF